MSITFYDKQEAQEYAREKQKEGMKTSIIRTGLGSDSIYVVSLSGKIDYKKAKKVGALADFDESDANEKLKQYEEKAKYNNSREYIKSRIQKIKNEELKNVMLVYDKIAHGEASYYDIVKLASSLHTKFIFGKVKQHLTSEQYEDEYKPLFNKLAPETTHQEKVIAIDSILSRMHEGKEFVNSLYGDSWEDNEHITNILDELQESSYEN